MSAAHLDAALQGFASIADGSRCRYWGGAMFAAWHLGRIRAELGELPPRRIRLLDASHLQADGQVFQYQEGDGFVALIPIELPCANGAPLKGD